MEKVLAISALALLVSSLASVARADEDAPSEDAVGDEVEAIDVPATLATPDERRDPAFYRGRSHEPTPEEVLVWIPRVVLFPVHLVTEYLLRIPVVALLAWAERNHLFALFELVFSPTPDFSWSPTISLEAGVFAVPGLQARWRNMGVAGHELRIAGTFAGDTFWSAALRDQWTIAPFHLGVRASHSTRPDRAYYGLGPGSPSQRTNFSETRSEAFAFLGIAHESHVRVELQGGWSGETVGRGMAPSIQAMDDAAALGFGPLDLALVTLDLRLDSRREVEENGGVRLHAVGTYGVDPTDGAYEFLTVNVDVEAAVEVSSPDRVVAARVHVAETVPLSTGPVPFLHLARLGWDNHQGFVLGRFRGEAAFLAEIRYRYPVHYFVDFQWLVSAGNVFARDFSDFSAGALTGSLGIGIRTRRTGSDPIEATLAFGTSRFDESFSIESVRFYLSTTEGL